jgi:hypothetical protein
MNERIVELAVQADLLIKKTNGDEFRYGYFDPKFQKFAELIVRECADLFVNQKYMILNPHEPFANERVRALKEHDKDTVNKIKQHFGVEE